MCWSVLPVTFSPLMFPNSHSHALCLCLCLSVCLSVCLSLSLSLSPPRWRRSTRRVHYHCILLCTQDVTQFVIARLFDTEGFVWFYCVLRYQQWFLKTYPECVKDNISFPPCLTQRSSFVVSVCFTHRPRAVRSSVWQCHPMPQQSPMARPRCCHGQSLSVLK